ncbi:hypothetical protein [Paenibacillus lautus]|uniref:hypothetical protein n=1 Tax=Paenibacillus lautus TaxID=1401 RepID=UPI001FEB0A18|nr:hypothetical protein [Paenibacillus lautus]
MAYCIHCGNELTDGVAHQCVNDTSGNPMKYTAAAAEPEQGRADSASAGAPHAKTSSAVQVDGQVLLNLLKNPMSALNMRGDQDRHALRHHRDGFQHHRFLVVWSWDQADVLFRAGHDVGLV